MPDVTEKNLLRVNILGVGVHPLTMQAALDQFDYWIRKRTPNYVCVTPAHAIMDCYGNPELQKIYNHSGLTTPDGMAIVWLTRMAGYNTDRVYGPDLLLAACDQFQEQKYRHYFYGGAPKVLSDLIEKLKLDYPDTIIAGSESPPFRDLSEEEINDSISRISKASPDILWIGLGSPKQEKWMSEYFQLLNVPVVVGVGAAFDFLSGNKPQAPVWIQRIGFEWLFRLISEPKRLWRRYARYPKFVWLVILQKLGLKKFQIS
jgi:N-acetylglucosaminyldiphosphoundecaprenol N-acetyl-beta-D-mannosaminyltransferase